MIQCDGLLEQIASRKHSKPNMVEIIPGGRIRWHLHEEGKVLKIMTEGTPS